MIKTLTTRCIVTFNALDVLFNPLVIAAFVPLVGMHGNFAPYWMLAVAVVIKMAVASWFLKFSLAPYERYQRLAGSARTGAALVKADEAIQAFPARFAVFFSFCWSAVYGIGYLVIRATATELPVTHGAHYGVVLVAVAVWFGGFAYSYPLASMLTSDAAGECSVLAREGGVPLNRPPGSLQTRIGVIALALGLGPTLWMMALGYMKQIESSQVSGEREARLAVAAMLDVARGATEEESLAALQRIAESEPGKGEAEQTRFIVNTRGEVLAGTAGARRLLQSAALSSWLVPSLNVSESGQAQLGELGVNAAYSRVGEDRFAVAVVKASNRAATGFVVSASVFAVLVGVWAPLCALVLGRAVSNPIERLTSAARQIVEEGRQSEMSSLPVANNDEVGGLSDRFNDLIEMMRDLSQAADAIANGDLNVDVQRQGELPDAFRRMTDSLRQIVTQIRETSVDLASATTEILAASQEQEAAAASQSSAMEEISRTMDSLSQSAAHVSESVQGVLANAEQTLQNTDDMVERIGLLSLHAGRIGQILEVIRDIADRSDLLALNGSLEASRAGEGGAGFALVASEMRRLAERVTASVEDIKKLVVDIRDSGSTTVTATDESRRLAHGTTEAARQITFVTQQQRSGTEQVSQSIKSIADVVTQAVSATSQTRTSAEGLKMQAEKMAELLRRFEVATVGAE